ncbi:unnamed protein product, partial [Pleuronectes platessa]
APTSWVVRMALDEMACKDPYTMVSSSTATQCDVHRDRRWPMKFLPRRSLSTGEKLKTKLCHITEKTTDALQVPMSLLEKLNPDLLCSQGTRDSDSVGHFALLITPISSSSSCPLFNEKERRDR